MRSRSSLFETYHQITKLHSSKTGHQKRFHLHTTKCSSSQMHDELPRDFQTGAISVWLTNSSYGQLKLNLVWLWCATRRPSRPTSLFPRYSWHCFFHSIWPHCQSLISEITQPDNIPHALDSCSYVWSSTNSSLPENTNLQRQWDDIKSSSRSATLRPLLDLHRLACLSSSTQLYSGAWMNCLPSTAIGTLMDNESFRIATSQRLGLPVCAPHKFRCGAIVDRYSLHPLSCRLSAGRLPRHSALNDIIKRALSSAGFNAVLVPVDLDRGDGKRPDCNQAWISISLSWCTQEP